MNPLRSTLVAILALGSLTAAAPASPPRGSVAPVVTLKDLSGESVSTSKFAGRAFVLVFGELGHEGTEHACEDVIAAIAEPRLTDAGVVPVLVVAHDVPAAQLKDEASQGHYPAIILHDPARLAFGAYRVMVLPSLVVVDAKGKVVYCMPGYLGRPKDLLSEAILTAAGKQTVAQFDQVLEARERGAPSPEVLKADRLVRLGAELSRHGMFDTAEARFKEALAASPGHVGATLGLGELLLRLDHLPEAEQCFKSLLAISPDSTDAQLGLAAIQVRRGGEHLAGAEAAVKALLDKNPSLPRARFLMGQICELRGDIPAAMAEYKAASKLLMER